MVRLGKTTVGAALVVLCACPPNNPPQLADAGPNGGLDASIDAGAAPDAGPDAGSDAGLSNPELWCDVGLQTCDGGSCLHVRLTDGGLGSRCLPGACDLVRQDCPGDARCTYLAVDGGYARSCAPAGDGGEGEACTGTPVSNTCQRGLTCAGRALADGGSAELCQRFCNSTSDCAGGDVCFVLLSPNGTDERPLLCGPPAPTCDVFAQDCQRPGDSCYLGDPSSCYPTGTQDTGGACAYANDCQRGLVCAGSAPTGVCRQLCRPGGAPVCSAGSCTPISGFDAGVCL